MLDDETQYKLLKIVETNPEISQRKLASKMGISLGKANYCLKAVVERGLVKARNFYNSENKRGYAYLLTPKGIETKAQVTVRFLKRKQKEYEILHTEILQLQNDADNLREQGILPPGDE